MLCALLAGVFRYVDDHFHDPVRFFENTESLADNADVRERLFSGFRTEIIAIAEGIDPSEVGTATDDAVDDEPDADDDDGNTDADDAEDSSLDATVPVTDARIERDQAIEAVLLDVFDSDAYDEVFDDQLGLIQAQVVRAAELPDEALLRDPGQVTFDARRLYQPIYTALAADPRTAEITQNAVPETFGVYPVADRETTLNAVWWTVENGPSWRGLTYGLAILSLIGAVVVAERRPTRAIQFGAGMVGLALVVIVVIYIVRAVVPLLASGSGDGAVVATYAANLAPLVSTMIRMLIIGVVIAAVGGVARLIWPDDWVYGQVSDDRGVRSIRRRRSAQEVEQPQQQQVPVAAAVPVAYPAYPQPYATYPAWGAPHPAQPYGGPYPAYPAGPYAQPVPGHVPARATMPVVPGGPETIPTGENMPVGPGGPSSNGLPADAAGMVPRVVADAASSNGDDHAHPFADAVSEATDPVDEPTQMHDTLADDHDHDHDDDERIGDSAGSARVGAEGATTGDAGGDATQHDDVEDADGWDHDGDW